MTDSSGAPNKPEASFHGPADLLEPWNDFLRSYTDSGTVGQNADNARLLDQLAFRDGSTTFAELHARDPQGYRHARKCVEDAARALSKAASDSTIRPLHRAMVSALVSQWIDLESRHGLYPPPLQVVGRGAASEARRAAVHRQRAALLQRPDAAVVAGALRMAESTTISRGAAAVHNRFRHTTTYDEVLGAAHDVFDKALFMFRHDQGASFDSFVQGGMRRFLQPTVRQEYRRGRLRGAEVGLEAPDEVAAKPDSSSPDTGASAAETHEQITRTLDSLEPRERHVLRLRYGLEDGITHTLEAISERIGVSKERVRQLQASGLEHCRRSLSRPGDALDKPTSLSPTRGR